MQSKLEARIHEKGQILLIVVLTMVVALTVGLSVASRIVSELRISSQNEESQKAFQAAEAGIQESLRQDNDIASSVISAGTTFSSEIERLEGNTIFVNAGIDVDQDTGADVWLSNYSPDPALNFQNPTNGPAKIYWGRPDQDSECVNSTPGTNMPELVPAIEVVILEEPGGTLGIRKFVFESSSCGGGSPRIPGAITSNAGGTITDPLGGPAKTFLYSADIDYTDGKVMKVIPIYNSTEVALVTTGQPFPEQGKTIISTGESGSTQRRIKYYTSLPQLPIEVFPYSILSQ